MSTILCLDLATRIGWAVGDPELGPIEWSAIQLPKHASLGAFAGHAQTAIVSLLWDEVDAVWYEAPILPSKTNISTLRKLYLLPGLLEMWCNNKGKRVYQAPMQSVRKQMIGTSRAPTSVPAKERRQWIKRRVIEAVCARGWKTADDDAADALAIFGWVMCSTRPEFAIESTPLFRKRTK